MAKSKKVNKSKKLTEFTCFKKLAPELRNMVWAAALPEANIVEIEVIGELTMDHDKKWADRVTMHARYKVPILLQISHESREVALKHYTKLFPEKFKDKPVFFNLAIDVLCLQDGDTLETLCQLNGFNLDAEPGDPTPAFKSPIMHGLRRLQVHEDIWEDIITYMHKILDAFGQPELIVLHKPYPRRRCPRWSGSSQFKILQQNVKNGVGPWAISGENSGHSYAPKFHILTNIELKEMIVGHEVENEGTEDGSEKKWKLGELNRE
ncbi:hypothetical protein N431DRAFT_532305 [Stipitochalara longipes BDJ]|nr:hypothetical protein N431DRAFT_532305 [Stipitochalara longipes BDJ]